MRRILLVAISLLAGLLTVSRPAMAHHAWRGFDASNRTTLKGVVTEYDFSNPHISVIFEVTDDRNFAGKWNAGGPSPARLAGSGWDKDTLKPGQEIVFTGLRNKNGAHEMRLEKVTFSDGRELVCYGNR